VLVHAFRGRAAVAWHGVDNAQEGPSDEDVEDAAVVEHQPTSLVQMAAQITVPRVPQVVTAPIADHPSRQFDGSARPAQMEMTVHGGER
jgi:hypothetical protein